ncbi:hypothetical protein QAD02_010028 [Eretmocerus hayati]|uniref:Uncharacterized protein n=1 Tax=Eretmocerus hayati TaxID=131215 RepID=A0ACC2NB12_9HYME|nr:hypothetical protein QAD02_010028 [Eretmocerus hayati]
MKVTFILLSISILVPQCTVLQLECDSCSVMESKCSDTEYNVIAHILEDIKFYQILFFLHEFKSQEGSMVHCMEMDSIVKNISTSNSVMFIESSELKTENKIRSYQKIFKNPRHGTLFITVADIRFTTLEEAMILFKNDLDLLISISKSTRPQYLLMIRTESGLHENSSREILKYAWRKKFLDFTILQFVSNCGQCKSCLFYNSYNPYNDSHSQQCNFHGSKIFPNKIMNMYQYPLRISLLHRPPYFNFDENQTGHPVNISGSDFGVWDILSQTLNFSMDFVSPKNIVDYAEPIPEKNFSSLLQLIISDDIDCSGNQIYINLVSTDSVLPVGERGLTTWFDDLIALVPIYQCPTWKIEQNSILILIALTIHVAVIYLVVRILKFNSQKWLPLYIFQIILGNPVSTTPGRWIERIFFFFLYILSQQYSVNIFARLTDSSLNEFDLGPFYTVDDLMKYQITIENHMNYFNMTFDNDDDSLQKLRNQIVVVNNIMDCPERIAKRERVACFIEKSVALGFIAMKENTRRPRMKILNHRFWSSGKGIIYASHSPYVPTFNKIIQRICECGLWMRYSQNDGMFQKSSKSNQFERDQLLSKKITMVWFCGCVLASIAFFSEIIVNYYEKMQ